MLAEAGQILLLLSLTLALLQGTLGLWGAQSVNGRLMAFADHAAMGQAVFLATAFALLASLFLESDFSVALVANYSHTSKPLLYKLSGAWGNHEGSMLLWVMIVAIFGGAMAFLGQSLPSTLRARAIGVQGIIGAGFLGFLIFTSNPFTRLDVIPADGSGLNPLLQDPGLAFHPPFLYLGYVGFSVAFSFAIAALIEGRVDALWARFVRPWVLAAWSFLTIGIALGSLWAYYELGWGGWWFWDPVENVSLMPWLAGTALLHSTLVVEKRHTFMNWTLLLAIATFSLSLIGTFIVRSGVLTSVHAFAVDPERGVFLLGLLALATGGALTLYAIRANRIASTTTFDAVSREGSLVLNNLLLCAATATVFIGTFYPLLIDALSNSKLTVGPPYFNMTFAPIMTILILFMGVGPLLKWRLDDPKRLAKPLAIMAVSGGALAILVAIIGKSVLGALAIGLALFLLISAVLTFADKARIGKIPMADSFKLMTRLPAAAFGFLLGHVGLAVTMVGVTSMSVWSSEDQLALAPAQSAEVAGYEVLLQSVSEGEGENYISQSATLDILKDGRTITTLRPERRLYKVEQQMTTEAALDVGFTRNLFAAVGEGLEDGRYRIRFYVHPFVGWIWGGALIMAIGGFISLADARFRLPSRKTAGSQAVPAPAE
ncbi:MAG: heme lyase NrfEFG subunit NrfE [Ponticaulis sp.]|nr:heme lyase NrfEFG subunit NrfE [Ponticaulis sp.]